MEKKTYLEKLKDPRWQRKRLEVFQRDHWTCRECRSTEDTLNVHHLYYESGHDPWDYPDDALQTLCEGCHRQETESRPDAEAQLLAGLRRGGFTARHLFMLTSGINLSRTTETPAWVKIHVADKAGDLFPPSTSEVPLCVSAALFWLALVMAAQLGKTDEVEDSPIVFIETEAKAVAIAVTPIVF